MCFYNFLKILLLLFNLTFILKALCSHRPISPCTGWGWCHVRQQSHQSLLPYMAPSSTPRSNMGLSVLPRNTLTHRWAMWELNLWSSNQSNHTTAAPSLSYQLIVFTKIKQGKKVSFSLMIYIPVSVSRFQLVSDLFAFTGVKSSSEDKNISCSSQVKTQ